MAYDYKPNQAGALIYFKESVTKEQAEKALAALKDLVDWQQVDTFDNRWGGPVWYIP